MENYKFIKHKTIALDRQLAVISYLSDNIRTVLDNDVCLTYSNVDVTKKSPQDLQAIINQASHVLDAINNIQLKLDDVIEDVLDKSFETVCKER